jgi:hypothetical protein
MTNICHFESLPFTVQTKKKVATAENDYHCPVLLVQLVSCQN